VAAIVAKLEMASKRVQLGRTVHFETTAGIGEVLGAVGGLEGKGYPLGIPNTGDDFGIHGNTEHVVPHIGAMEHLIFEAVGKPEIDVWAVRAPLELERGDVQVGGKQRKTLVIQERRWTIEELRVVVVIRMTVRIVKVYIGSGYVI
jgi:hypothetical protein